MSKEEPYQLEDALGYWLHLTFNRLRARTVEMFHEAGYRISPEQWALLTRLWIKDGVSQTELAHLTFRDKASVTRMVDALEEQGFVRREPHLSDRRRHNVVLSDKGRGLEAELVPMVRAFLKDCYKGLSREQEEQTRQVLMTIYGNLTD